jgi:hypothetical protein
MKRHSIGYSGRSLVGKLGIKEGARVLVLGDAPDYSELLGALPAGMHLVSRAGRTVDLVHLFTLRRADLERRLEALRASLRPDAVVWVSWPKKASKVPTDITEDVIREVALPLGFVDIKVCAVTDVWSGLKLVVRTALR